jgi:hypothetical protein
VAHAAAAIAPVRRKLRRERTFIVVKVLACS